MSTTLFESNGGDIVLTQCSNGLGRGTRLELAAHSMSGVTPDPAEIRDPAVAYTLARALILWAEGQT